MRTGRPIGPRANRYPHRFCFESVGFADSRFWASQIFQASSTSQPPGESITIFLFRNGNAGSSTLNFSNVRIHGDLVDATPYARDDAPEAAGLALRPTRREARWLPRVDYPNVNANATASGSRNSISNWRGAIGFG